MYVSCGLFLYQRDCVWEQEASLRKMCHFARLWNRPFWINNISAKTTGQLLCLLHPHFWMFNRLMTCIFDSDISRERKAMGNVEISGHTIICLVQTRDLWNLSDSEVPRFWVEMRVGVPSQVSRSKGRSIWDSDFHAQEELNTSVAKERVIGLSFALSFYGIPQWDDSWIIGEGGYSSVYWIICQSFPEALSYTEIITQAYPEITQTTWHIRSAMWLAWLSSECSYLLFVIASAGSFVWKFLLLQFVPYTKSLLINNLIVCITFLFFLWKFHLCAYWVWGIFTLLLVTISLPASPVATFSLNYPSII